MKKILLPLLIGLSLTCKAQKNTIDTVFIRPAKVLGVMYNCIIANNPFLPNDTAVQFAYTIFDSSWNNVNNGNQNINFGDYNSWRNNKPAYTSPGESVALFLGLTPR